MQSSSASLMELVIPMAYVLTPNRLWRHCTSVQTSREGSLEWPSVINTTSMQLAAGSRPHVEVSKKSQAHVAAPAVCVHP